MAYSPLERAVRAMLVCLSTTYGGDQVVRAGYERDFQQAVTRLTNLTSGHNQVGDNVPELLEAAQMALEWLENIAEAGIGSQMMDYLPNNSTGRIGLRAAIDKATA